MYRKRKIGRNDPCPCGSGKKFKYCCGSRSNISSSTLEIADHINLNKAIAYVGKVGHMRQEFCVKYLEHKAVAFNEIERVLRDTAKAAGETITCHKGCYFCCSQHVSTSLQESETIVYYLYQHEYVLDRFSVAYPKWRASVGKDESLFKAIGQLYNQSVANGFQEETQQAYFEAAQRYVAQNIPCPFLTEGICSIYEVRPWACASVVATSPAEWCSPLNENKPKILTTYLALTKEMPMYGNASYQIVSTAPLAVYELLKGGTLWLSLVPGLESLESEARSDPEVKETLTQHLKKRTS